MRLHHVGIVIPHERQVDRFREILGLKERSRGYVENYKAICIFMADGEGVQVELIVSELDVLRTFNRGAGGLHHIAFLVDDLAETTKELASKGVKLLEDHPVKGAGDFIVNFVPPVYAGVLVEIVQLSQPGGTQAHEQLAH